MNPSNQNNDIIGKTLDLAPMQVLPAQNNANTQTTSDFEYARGNLIDIIEKGQEALSGILDVAGMSQHPRSYEVVATLINTLTTANKDLLELTKKRQEIEGNVGGKPTTVNNNLFVGSTAELQKLIKQQNEQE